jgi:hypothetical protein
VTPVPAAATDLLLAELARLHEALPLLRFGDRCFSCPASCCLRVHAGEYAVLLLPGEMFRLVQSYPALCDGTRFRRLHEIEVLTGCGASTETAACPIGCHDFDCRVFPMYVTADDAGQPLVRVDERCPLAGEVPPATVAALQELLGQHPALFGPYARSVRAHYATVARGDQLYADAEPIPDEAAYLRARGFQL